MHPFSTGSKRTSQFRVILPWKQGTSLRRSWALEQTAVGSLRAFHQITNFSGTNDRNSFRPSTLVPSRQTTPSSKLQCDGSPCLAQCLCLINFNWNRSVSRVCSMTTLLPTEWFRVGVFRLTSTGIGQRKVLPPLSLGLIGETGEYWFNFLYMIVAYKKNHNLPRFLHRNTGSFHNSSMNFLWVPKKTAPKTFFSISSDGLETLTLFYV